MSTTPLSDAALLSFPDFMEAVRARLENGKREYGDASFKRPTEDILGELAQELLDQAGWAFIGYCRIMDALRALRSVESHAFVPPVRCASDPAGELQTVL